LHAAALLKLAKDAGQTREAIYTYVAAKSYSRMLQNFQHELDSKPFIDRLLNISASQALARERPVPSQQTIDPRLRANDTTFIEFLCQPFTEHFLHLSEIGIPNLLRIMNSARENSAPEPISLYTNDTCEDFHRLLCHLIKSYETALVALDKFKDCSSVDCSTPAFHTAIYGLATCCLALRALVYSSFIEEHLCRIRAPDIRPRRPNDRSHIYMQSDMNLPVDAKPIEFQSSGMDSGWLSVHKAYLHCLRSQAAHFEAADELVMSSARLPSARMTLRFITTPKADTLAASRQRCHVFGSRQSLRIQRP
jgi:hypothetical protein